jgi:hypothetical protein
LTLLGAVVVVGDVRRVTEGPDPVDLLGAVFEVFRGA